VILDSRKAWGIFNGLQRIRLDTANILISGHVQTGWSGHPERAFRVRLLRTMERLEEVDLGPGMQFAVESSAGIFDLAELKTLSVNISHHSAAFYAMHTTTILQIFRDIRMPNLVNLHFTIRTPWEPQPWSDDVLKALISKVETVTSLRLEGMQFGSTSLLQLLETTPQLRILHLNCCTISGQLLYLLEAKSPVLIPHLHTLCLMSTVWRTKPFAASLLHVRDLEDFLATRAWARGDGSQRLTEVQITRRIEGGTGKFIDEEILQRLEAHVARVTVKPPVALSSFEYDLDFDRETYGEVAPTYV